MAETLATYSVPEHYVKMYTENVQAVLQKKGGLLRSTVSIGAYHGDKCQVVNFIGTVEFTERTSVYADTKLTELEHTQKWITGKEYDCAVLVDRLDTLKMIYDPTSPYVERFREAAARREDEIIMGKFFADVKVGVDGTGTSVFNSGLTTVVAEGGTGMSVAKLRSLRKLMKKRHIDLRSSRPMIAVTADEADALLAEVAVASADYNAVKPLVDGEVSAFMGFTFIPYEDNGTVDYTNGKGIPVTTSGGNITRHCPAWVMEGMHLGNWDGLAISIDKRPDKNNIQQIHGHFMMGATRLEEGKVFSLDVRVTP